VKIERSGLELINNVAQELSNTIDIEDGGDLGIFCIQYI
jgi:hypothetical protein